MYGTAMMGLLGGGGNGNLFAATSYTGNGGTQDIITGQNLVAGGLVWGKETGATGNHEVADTARGANLNLYPNLTLAEQTRNSITAFNANGFSVGTGDGLNGNGDSIVAFTWLKQAGYMDEVLYTGNTTNRTINYDLGVAYKLGIFKQRSGSGKWIVYHESLGATKFLTLNETTAAVTDPQQFNNTAPTSSVFSLGTSGDVNVSGGTYVAYLFAEKAGKSKFGSYTGTGASNAITGTGFTPKLVMIKRTDSTGDWMIAYNNGTAIVMLKANTSDAAFNKSGYIDTFDANGFTVLTNTAVNASGGTYIYAAWG